MHNTITAISGHLTQVSANKLLKWLLTAQHCTVALDLPIHRHSASTAGTIRIEISDTQHANVRKQLK